MELLPIRRNGGRGDSLRETFVVDKCHVERAKAIWSACRIEILATGLDLQNLGLGQWPAQLVQNVAAMMLLSKSQQRSIGQVLLIPLRISDCVQRAADHRLRL